jgi:hypothetical protein
MRKVIELKVSPGNLAQAPRLHLVRIAQTGHRFD